MDLKSGTLFWPDQNGSAPANPHLSRDLRCDVAIVGGGLTGALIASLLNQAGFDVVLLDKREIAQGSTSASAALLLYEIDTPLLQLKRMLGTKDAVRSYQVCLNAIYEIERVIRCLGDDCGFERKQSLYLASRARDVPDLRKECHVRAKSGLRVEYLSSAELQKHFSLKAPGAILSRDAAEMNPYRFAHRLVEHAVRRGLRVYSRTEARCFEESRGRVLLHANGNGKVIARRLVIAAGFESQRYLSKKLVQLKSTYAIATRPLKGLDDSKQPLIWETAHPYHYLRATRDGRIMIGGEDEDFHDPDERDRLIPRKTRRLELAITKFFPDLKARAEYAWAGTFGETKDGLPYIGRVRGHPNVIYALCYGANGTNFAMIAAELIRDCLLETRNPDAHIFSLDR